MAKSSEQRSFTLLRASGSTARVLNLALVNERHGQSEEYLAKPLFKVPALNKTLLIKHVVRTNERDLFDSAPTSTTKVVFLFSKEDLALGGHAILYGERNFEKAVRSVCGSVDPAKTEADLELISLLNSLPSFDPFLTRERLKQSGYEPARCYFDLSEADVAKMREFAAEEIRQLVNLAFANGGQSSQDLARRLADKLMTDETAKTLDPLRTALQLAETDYREGIFSWKGFIYYRWISSISFPTLADFKREVLSTRIVGAEAELRERLVDLRRRMIKTFDAAVERVQLALVDYGSAFAGLSSGDSRAFRDFLLDAPRLFIPIGEALGAIQHIKSFWQFRFPVGKLHVIPAEEAIELFNDFVATLDSLTALSKANQPSRSACLSA